MAYQCGRCGGTYWQTDPKYRAAMERAQLAEARGDVAGALRIYEDTMGRESA